MTEPVAPCSPRQFRAIVAPLLALARRLERANDPDKLPEGAFREGSDTYTCADTLRANADTFAYFWDIREGAEGVRDLPEVRDRLCDADMAAKFAGTHAARHGRVADRDPGPDGWPEIQTAARQVAAHALYEPDGRIRLDLARLRTWDDLATPKQAPHAVFAIGGNTFLADRSQLRRALRTLTTMRRTHDAHVHVQLEHAALAWLVFRWPSGQYRLPLEAATAGDLRASCLTLALQAPAPVAVAPPVPDTVPEHNAPVHVAPEVIEPVAPMAPALENPCICTVEEDMNASDMQTKLAALKANLSVFGAGTGAVLCILYQQAAPKGKIAQGKGATLDEALSDALKGAKSGEAF